MLRRPAFSLLALLLVPNLPLSAPAQAPAPPDTTTFTSEALILRFTYPSTLHETIGLVTQREACCGSVVPSKVYGLMAAGVPSSSSALVLLPQLISLNASVAVGT